MAREGEPERTRLNDGLSAIRPLLEARGFTYSEAEQAVSSGGSFAVANFSRGDMEIGLIVRNGSQLGCPNYAAADGYVGHDDLIWALGHEGKEQLVEGDWHSFRARDGGNVFDALRADLELIILPVLDRSEEAFRTAVAGARAHLQEKRGW
jgi:hypothetical protein